MCARVCVCVCVCVCVIPQSSWPGRMLCASEMSELEVPIHMNVCAELRITIIIYTYNISLCIMLYMYMYMYMYMYFLHASCS